MELLVILIIFCIYNKLISSSQNTWISETKQTKKLFPKQMVYGKE